jgi:hypothetical protein
MQVSGFAEYSDQTEKWFAELADRGSSVAISFRFVECIFQIVSKRSDGDERTFYGHFRTCARRTNGHRRTYVDYEVDDVDAFSAQGVTST